MEICLQWSKWLGPLNLKISRAFFTAVGSDSGLIGMNGCLQTYPPQGHRLTHLGQIINQDFCFTLDNNFRSTVNSKTFFLQITVGWGTKAQCFCPPYLKTWFFYVVFNAELNGTIRILCFHHDIIDLMWPSKAQLCHSLSIMVWRKN